MRIHFQPLAEIGLIVFSWSLLCVPAVTQAGPSDPSVASSDHASLPLEQIVKNLQERNAQRAAALDEFVGTRVYRMQYRGFPSDRDAEMVVNVERGDRLKRMKRMKTLLQQRQSDPETANDPAERSATLQLTQELEDRRAHCHGTAFPARSAMNRAARSLFTSPKA